MARQLLTILPYPHRSIIQDQNTMARDQSANTPHLPPHQQREVTRRLGEGHLQLIPTAVAGNIINAALLIVPFGWSIAPGKLAGVIGAIVGMSLLLLTFWAKNRERVDHCPELVITRAIGLATAMGLTWGVAIYYLMSVSTLPQLAMLGMLAAGMMAAATLTCATVPKAGWAFILPIAVATIINLLQRGAVEYWVTTALLLSFIVVLHRNFTTTYANHIERLIGQIQLAENAQSADEAAATVRLLLNDFEEHGSDWLWETDAKGRLIAPSARFAQVAQRPAETLAGTPLIALFNQCPERGILDDHVRSARSFRDITVPLTIAGEHRWWSLSGHPFVNKDGKVRLRGVATDISAAKNAEVKVAYMAHYDGLTDLPNRFLFNDTINHALHRQRPGMETAILSLDLDHFKTVNDTLGHPAGDMLLQMVSRRIEGCLRQHDIVARMGGDEFAILMTGVQDRTAVEAVAQDILRSINDAMIIDGHQVISAASIGIAMAPTDGSTAETLMKNVDLALYSAKADGRNRFAFFAPEMDDAAQARRRVETDLRTAISRDELALHYQPLINVESGETVGYEALLRWYHPQRGLVMPNDFVPVAEETGLIVQLGEWVIRNAIAEAAGWPDHLGVSINISPLQMKSGSLISTIVNAIARAQIAPERVEVEITETVLMHETEVNLATLHRLREIGVRIALDDFGTGYSSLNYLRSFPFDKIKIDRCFIEDVERREDCRAIVRAVTGLAS
ncbi:MAG: putative bifunctional diguanylate cyclase/phosphodiesterase, partial [Sphingopyxis sp.]